MQKTVVFFDSICYTTLWRQKEAELIAEKSEIMLIIGDKSSSNTNKLIEICRKKCIKSYLIEKVTDLKSVQIDKEKVLGIVSAASAPKELIMEVFYIMSEINTTDENKVEVSPATENVPETKQLFLEGILSGNLQPCVWLMFCKRKIYTEYNILPVPFVNFGEDYALTPRLLYKVNTIVSIPDVLYFYVHDNDSSYCSVWKNGYIQEREQTLDVLKKFFHNADPVYVECITKNIIRTKCHFYRMYANSRKNNSDLKKINEWHTEIPLKTLLRSAQLPYKPIVVLGFLHLDFLLRCYVISCRFIYRNLMRFFS